MQLTIFPYLEDYLECIAGYAAGNRRPVAISLARYDIAIVQSLAGQTLGGIGLTDRQLELAKKIVAKYRRQLASQYIDIAEQAYSPVMRIPVRKVDRTKNIEIVDGKLIIRFPYDKDIIEYIRQFRSLGCGSMHFDQERKVWLASMTEPMFLFFDSLMSKFGFTVSEEFSQILSDIKLCEQEDYTIELQLSNDTLHISHATDSLVEHINQNHGGFSLSNLLKLSDLSGVYEYKISSELQSALTNIYSEKMLNFFTGREFHTQDIDSIFQYAELTNRYPVYVYSLSMDFLRTDLIRILGEEHISFGTPKTAKPYKCIVLSKLRSQVERIPLLITTQAMMVGPRRSQIKQFSDKVVYYTDTIFHPINKQ